MINPQDLRQIFIGDKTIQIYDIQKVELAEKTVELVKIYKKEGYPREHSFLFEFIIVMKDGKGLMLGTQDYNHLKFHTIAVNALL